MKRRVPDPDPPDPGFNCWSRLPHRISCVWSRSISSPEVNCKKVHEKTDPLASKRCFIDPSLATEDKIGCTTDSLADFYSQYEIELSSSGVAVQRIDDFDIGKYLVIEEAPKDFSASRIDGRVRLEWNDSGNHWLNILYGDELVLELLYKPYLQVAGLKRRFIGYEKDLQGVIMLNDIPNSEVLELCIRVRKDDSLRKEWSPCSNTVTLMPISQPTTLPSTIAPEDFPCEKYDICTNKEGTHDKMKKDVTLLTSSIIVVGSIVFLIIIIKSSWKKIHLWLLPPIPEPIIVIHEDEDNEEEDELENEGQSAELIEETRLLTVEKPRSSRTEACLRTAETRRSFDSGIAAAPS